MLFGCTDCMFRGTLVQEGKLDKNRMLKNDPILRRRGKKAWCLSNMRNSPPTTCTIHNALLVMEQTNEEEED